MTKAELEASSWRVSDPTDESNDDPRFAYEENAIEVAERLAKERGWHHPVSVHAPGGKLEYLFLCGQRFRVG